MKKQKKINKQESFNCPDIISKKIYEFPDGVPKKLVTLSGATITYTEFPSPFYFAAGIIVGLIIGIVSSI